MFFGADNTTNNNDIAGISTGGTSSISNNNGNSSNDNLFSFSNEDSNEDLYSKTERENNYILYGDDKYKYNYKESTEDKYDYEDKKEDRDDRDSVIEELRQENEKLKSELLEAKSVRQEYFRLFQENKYLIDKMHELELSYLNKLSTANQKIKTLQSQLDGATAASQQIQSNWIQVAEHLATTDSPEAPSDTSSSTVKFVENNNNTSEINEDEINNNNEIKDNNNELNNDDDDDENHFFEIGGGTPQTQKSNEFFSQEYDEAQKKIMRAVERMQEVERMREELRKTRSSLAELESKHTSSQRASAGRAQENERLNTILEGQNTLLEILSAAKKDLERTLATKDLDLAAARAENIALARKLAEIEESRAAIISKNKNSNNDNNNNNNNSNSNDSDDGNDVLEALRGELASEKRAAAELKSEFDELNEECLRQEQEIKQLREDLEILGAKKESSERIACTLTKEFLAFRKTVEARCESSQQEASQAEAERNTLREENARLTARVQERAAEIAKLRAENADLREKAQEQCTERETALQAAEKERESLVAKLDSLKHKCEMLQKLAESTIKKEEHSLQIDLNKEKEKEVEKEVLNSNELKKSTSVTFSVMLSGFKDTGTKKRITSELSRLGCTIVVDEKELATVTHLVVPTLETRTLKVVSAALTGKWVVTERWAAACAEAGFCVRETAFGFRVAQSPIAGKRVFFSQDFARDSNKLRSALAIVKVGGATRVLVQEDADIFLAHDLSAESFNAAAASFVAFDWPGFIEMLLKGGGNNNNNNNNNNNVEDTLKRKNRDNNDDEEVEHASKKRKVN